MRRKRRAKYTWLPVLGTAQDAGEEGINKAGRDFNLSANSEGTGQIIPLTADLPRDEGIVPGDEGALSDSIGQEWFLRRLVGKLSIFWGPSPEADSASQVRVQAGFLVARASVTDPDYPIGSTATWAASLTPSIYNAYDPGSNDTLREPWIWRRTWVLGNPSIDTDTNWPRGIVPAHNLGFASSLDGPHIDAKTMRRISNDDRLYFVISCQTIPLAEASGTGALKAHLDLRILGALRRARNRGNF